MPYCPKCGVEVEHGILKCPLCSFDIPEIPHEDEQMHEELELKNYYTELHNLKKKSRRRAKQIAFIVIIFGAIGAAFNNTMQDWLGNNRLTFSPYVLSSIGVFILYLISIFGFIHGWKKNLLFLSLGTTAFIFSIDFYSDGLGWFLPLGLPICILTFGLIFATAIIIRKLKPGKLYSISIISAAAAIEVILLELIIDISLHNIRLQWSLQALVPLVSISLLCILGKSLEKHDIFAKLKRYMHF